MPIAAMGPGPEKTVASALDVIRLAGIVRKERRRWKDSGTDAAEIRPHQGHVRRKCALD